MESRKEITVKVKTLNNITHSFTIDHTKLIVDFKNLLKEVRVDSSRFYFVGIAGARSATAVDLLRALAERHADNPIPRDNR